MTRVMKGCLFSDFPFLMTYLLTGVMDLGAIVLCWLCVFFSFFLFSLLFSVLWGLVCDFSLCIYLEAFFVGILHNIRSPVYFLGVLFALLFSTLSSSAPFAKRVYRSPAGEGLFYARPPFFGLCIQF